MPTRSSPRGSACPSRRRRSLRGAHDLVEARALVRGVLDPPSADVGTEPGDAGALRRAPRADAGALDKDGAKALQRELKAVGGEPARAARRADGRRARPGALGGAARRCRGTRRCGALYPRAVRLYDTFTRSTRRAAAAARARSGCTSAARPSTRARTSATRGRSSSGCGCARGCARPATRRSSSTTSPTSTTRSTTPRPARAPSSPRARPSGTCRTPATSGSACPTTLPKATESVPQIVHFIEELVDGGACVPGRRRRLLPGRELPRIRPALGPAARPGRGAGAEPAQGGRRATSRSGRRTSRRPRTPGGSRRGAGAGPGWHIECSAMAEEIYGPGVRDPRRRPRPRLPPSRERGRAVARRSAIRSRRSGRTTGCSGSPARRCRSRLGNVTTIREALDEWGARGGARLLPDGVLAQADRLLGRRRWSRRPRARETLRNAFTRAAAEHDEQRLGRVRGGARRRLRHAARARGPARLGLGRAARAACGVASRSSASSRSPSVTRRRPRCVALAERRAEARAERDFETSDRLRDELAALGWEMRDEPTAATTLVRVVTPDLVYGRRAVREALRGRREVLEVWATERALKAEPWLAEARPKPKADRELSERAETRDHQGVARARRAVPLCGRLRARRGRAAAARGARPGHRPAQPRSRLPERRRAPVRPGSSCPRTARRSSPLPSRAPRPARSSICRSRSSRTSRATSRR